jgi:hypothetical protein
VRIGNRAGRIETAVPVRAFEFRLRSRTRLAIAPDRRVSAARARQSARPEASAMQAMRSAISGPLRRPVIRRIATVDAGMATNNASAVLGSVISVRGRQPPIAASNPVRTNQPSSPISRGTTKLCRRRARRAARESATGRQSRRTAPSRSPMRRRMGEACPLDTLSARAGRSQRQEAADVIAPTKRLEGRRITYRCDVGPPPSWGRCQSRSVGPVAPTHEHCRWRALTFVATRSCTKPARSVDNGLLLAATLAFRHHVGRCWVSLRGRRALCRSRVAPIWLLEIWGRYGLA